MHRLHQDLRRQPPKQEQRLVVPLGLQCGLEGGLRSGLELELELELGLRPLLVHGGGEDKRRTSSSSLDTLPNNNRSVRFNSTSPADTDEADGAETRGAGVGTGATDGTEAETRTGTAAACGTPEPLFQALARGTEA